MHYRNKIAKTFNSPSVKSKFKVWSSFNSHTIENKIGVVPDSKHKNPTPISRRNYLKPRITTSNINDMDKYLHDFSRTSKFKFYFGNFE